MQCESSSSEEEVNDDNEDVELQVWNEIESKSDAEFQENYGLVKEVAPTSEDNIINPIDCYRHFITDEIIDIMVREPNRGAKRSLQIQKSSSQSETRQWEPITNEEMLKFIGVIIGMGLVQMPQMAHYWSKSKLYGSEIIQNTISRDKLELLLKFFHFSNNEEEHADQERLFKLKPLLHPLKDRFKSVYIPGSLITIDETMVPCRGRFLFKQYIPGKSHKYGVKIYKIAGTNGYIWNVIVYTGKQDTIADLGHFQTVVMDLSEDLLECYQNIKAGNFFTSLPLAKRLLRKNTYLIETLRNNRAGPGYKVVQKKLKRSEVYRLESKIGVKLIKWKDKRDVLVVSIKSFHSATVADTKQINKLNELIMKPQVIFDYNQGIQGSDLSDQLSAYYTCLRRPMKWYKKVAFELIFGTAVVNSYLIYKEKLLAQSLRD